MEPCKCFDDKVCYQCLRDRTSGFNVNHVTSFPDNSFDALFDGRDCGRTSSRNPCKCLRYVVNLDIEGFKAINDVLSHKVGDDILRILFYAMNDILNRLYLGESEKEFFIVHPSGDEIKLVESQRPVGGDTGGGCFLREMYESFVQDPNDARKQIREIESAVNERLNNLVCWLELPERNRESGVTGKGHTHYGFSGMYYAKPSGYENQFIDSIFWNELKPPVHAILFKGLSVHSESRQSTKRGMFSDTFQFRIKDIEPPGVWDGGIFAEKNPEYWLTANDYIFYIIQGLRQGDLTEETLTLTKRAAEKVLKQFDPPGNEGVQCELLADYGIIAVPISWSAMKSEKNMENTFEGIYARSQSGRVYYEECSKLFTPLLCGELENSGVRLQVRNLIGDIKYGR